MKKKLLITAVAILYFTIGYSQSGLWKNISEERLSSMEKTDRDNMPSKYELYQIDFQNLKNVLSTAPSRANYTSESQVIVSFPAGNGIMERYRVYEASVMHPDLAIAHPEIQSYVGKGIDSPSSTIRFTTTIFGFHGMIFSVKGTTYIDTYTKDLNNYIVYKKADLAAVRTFGCSTENSIHNPENASRDIVPFSTQASDGVLRTYRLALACTDEYANFHIDAAGVSGGTIAEKKAAVLAAMNVTMTRVNGIYETDLSVTMQIVADNEDIIYLTQGSNDLSNNNSGALLGEIQDVIDDEIGSANYDIGHVVSTGGGGIAQLGSVCSSFAKARGVTGSAAPVGDPFDVDYVAHEMGHQFGANHTFNANTGSCNGNRNQDTAVEPGSGTTIMGYAGICAQADVQSNSDAYFHAASLSEIIGFITAFATCSVETDNGNTPPVIPVIDSETIPAGTPFVLRGSATDADGDELTYCWEQTDNNGSASSAEAFPFAATGPNFRSLPPAETPDRYMPKLENVLAGDLAEDWEVVPSVSRTMNFALTVRDNGTPNGGQTARRNITVTFTTANGSFEVTSQNAPGVVWETGEAETVTWNVANTTAAPVSTANVNILLSTDGGVSFTTLLANTPNDGTETIFIPEDVELSTNCRVIVEAVDNIFYAVNTTPFSIDNTNSTDNFGLVGFKLYPNPNNGSFTVEFNSDSSNDINIAVYDMRGRQIFGNSFTNSGAFANDISLVGMQSGVYLVSVQDGNRKEVKRIVVE